jgi:hypothetical protein
MIGTSTMNPLASTVMTIRKGATSCFQAGFDQLRRDEQVKILSEIEFLSARSSVSIEMKNSTRESTEEKGYIRQSD